MLEINELTIAIFNIYKCGNLLKYNSCVNYFIYITLQP